MAKKLIINKKQIQQLFEKELFEQSGVKIPNKLIKQILKELKDFEWSRNYLIERRGVVAYPYLASIRNICDYVNDYIRNYKSDNENKWTIEIPLNLTAPIKLFKELHIIVTVRHDDGEHNFGNGESIVYGDDIKKRIQDNQWINETIKIDAFCDEDNILYRKTLYNNLIHEINHKAEELNAYLNGQVFNYVAYDAQELCAKPSTIIFSMNEERDKLIKNILYRLLSSSELNALIASVYGDLMGIDSKRENFARDIQEVQACHVYNEIFDNLDLLDTMPKSEWSILERYLNPRKKIGGNEFQLNVFKNIFIHRVDKALLRLYNGIYKAAESYYTFNEERQQIKESKNIVIRTSCPSIKNKPYKPEYLIKANRYNLKRFQIK